MLADRRILIRVITIAPIGAAALGFLAAAFFPWKTINQINKPIVNKDPIVEPSPKPKETPKPFIKTLPKAYQARVFEEVELPPNQKVIALTFDDGPLPGPTEKILQILKDNDIKATFFLIGRNVKQHPELVKKIYDDGHIIENHSWTHPYNRHTLAGSQAEIDNTSAEIAKITGRKPELFRPPGGLMHTGLAEYAKSQKMGIALWSADSQDYRAHNSPQRLLKNMLKEIKPGGMVLMHDGGAKRTNTIAALPVLIEKLKKEGYRFVTVLDLIALEAKTNSGSKTTLTKAKPITTPTGTF